MLSEEGKLVKQELENFNQAKRRLRNLQDELESWKRLDGAVKSASLEQSVSGGESVPYAERRILKIEELEDRFLKDIAQLDALSQNLLMERYMTGKSLKRIIREFNYSESQIFRFYNKAFEKIYLNRKDDSK